MFWKFFLVFIFLFEVLDASTMFVRTGLSLHSSIEQFGAPVASDCHTAKKSTKHHKITLDVSAHSALPVLQIPVFVAFQFEADIVLPDVTIPQLNPPISLLKRPPIIS